MNKVDEIVSELSKFSDTLKTIGDPINDHAFIFRFEEKFNLTLPLDYKYFISQVNGFSLMGTVVYGIHSHVKEESLESVYVREHFKVKVPQYDYLVPFSLDGQGNFYCFNTKNLTDSGDSCSIVFWVSNYIYSKEDEPEIVNDSFVDWVNEVVIGWTLEDYDYDGTLK